LRHWGRVFGNPLQCCVPESQLGPRWFPWQLPLALECSCGSPSNWAYFRTRPLLSSSQCFIVRFQAVGLQESPQQRILTGSVFKGSRSPLQTAALWAPPCWRWVLSELLHADVRHLLPEPGHAGTIGRSETPLDLVASMQPRSKSLCST